MPRDSLYILSLWPICRTISPRFGAGTIRHWRKAASATLSYASIVASLTEAMGFPSTGDRISSTAPAVSVSHEVPVEAPEFIFSIPNVLRKSMHTSALLFRRGNVLRRLVHSNYISMHQPIADLIY